MKKKGIATFLTFLFPALLAGLAGSVSRPAGIQAQECTAHHGVKVKEPNVNPCDPMADVHVHLWDALTGASLGGGPAGCWQCSEQYCITARVPGYADYSLCLDPSQNRNGKRVRVDIYLCPLATPTPTPTPTPSPTPTPEPLPPPCNLDLGEVCQETLTLYDYGLQCDEARSDVPCSLVDRAPYPQGMVTVKNTFEVTGPDLGGEAWTAPEPQGYPGGNYRNYRVGIRWRRTRPPESPDVAWNYDERPWNVAHGLEWGERGNPVDHTYETSSWGKPENGPGEDCIECLPGYQVYLQTFWRAQCASYWEHYECVEWDADGQCTRKDWVPRSDGWYDVDMQALGLSEQYYMRMPDGVDRYQPQQACGVVPVPIIEVQGVIQKP
jgi:hypothetical protein